ncbi:MAG: hypothetical protein KF796_11275 [Ramlibacter sp.]|nr:hypothetical protein [Ramlibacter sp.]
MPRLKQGGTHMADIWFKLGYPIGLDTMIPANNGVATNLPGGIHGNTQGGIYLILNPGQSNRYMGITTNFSKRFASRQGACFELGLPRTALANVVAFLGEVKYCDTGGNAWTTVNNYAASNTNITLDNRNYDYEHLFIKSVQHIWAFETVSNTVKVGALRNNHNANAITATVTWSGGQWHNFTNGTNGLDISLAAGNSWN